jgi:AcrR family transcriptional regulator
MSPDVLAPKQQRSRETLARLLRATIEMLEQHGLDGTTIPRVAAAAGVAPASVYRRFRDRDALYRAAFLAVLEQSAEANRKALRSGDFRGRTLEGVAGEFVAAIVQQYRAHPGLLRALVRFLENDRDMPFREKALAYIVGNFRGLQDVLLTFRDQIAHPAPERAAMFALLSLVSIAEIRALEQVSPWPELLPISDPELQAELSRLFLTYLQSP